MSGGCLGFFAINSIMQPSEPRFFVGNKNPSRNNCGCYPRHQEASTGFTRAICRGAVSDVTTGVLEKHRGNLSEIAGFFLSWSAGRWFKIFLVGSFNPTHLKDITASQIGSFPEVMMKIKEFCSEGEKILHFLGEQTGHLDGRKLEDETIRNRLGMMIGCEGLDPDVKFS